MNKCYQCPSKGSWKELVTWPEVWAVGSWQLVGPFQGDEHKGCLDLTPLNYLSQATNFPSHSLLAR